MTARAQKFVAANALSPVVYGSVVGSGGRGAVYRLANGLAFTLSAAECRAVGEIRWARVA